MANWARVDDGVVREVIATVLPLATLYHPSLEWVPVTGTDVAAGWLWDGAVMHAPVATALALPSAPTLAELEAQLAIVAGQLALMRA